MRSCSIPGTIRGNQPDFLPDNRQEIGARLRGFPGADIRGIPRTFQQSGGLTPFFRFDSPLPESRKLGETPLFLNDYDGLLRIFLLVQAFSLILVQAPR